MWVDESHQSVVQKGHCELHVLLVSIHSGSSDPTPACLCSDYQGPHQGQHDGCAFPEPTCRLASSNNISFASETNPSQAFCVPIPKHPQM